MCAEWLSGYGAFHSDMGLKPAGLTLHRIDNDGPYAPWNCKWADAKEQASNKYYPKHKPRHRVTVAGLLFGR